MPVYANIDGVWREVPAPAVKAAGIWRGAAAYCNIDGVWRRAGGLQESDIASVGFAFYQVQDGGGAYISITGQYLDSRSKIVSVVGKSSKTLGSSTYDICMYLVDRQNRRWVVNMDKGRIDEGTAYTLWTKVGACYTSSFADKTIAVSCYTSVRAYDGCKNWDMSYSGSFLTHGGLSSNVNRSTNITPPTPDLYGYSNPEVGSVSIKVSTGEACVTIGINQVAIDGVAKPFEICQVV